MHDLYSFQLSTMLGMLDGVQGITLYRDTLLVIQRKNMTRRQHWAKLAKDFKKNGRPFHYQYLIKKGGD